MKQELDAYLFRSDGRVSEMPTDELLSSLELLRQASIAQEPHASIDNVAVSAFLQAMKRAMRKPLVLHSPGHPKGRSA